MPRIVAETDALIAIDKPPGLIAHRDGRNIEPSVSERLGEMFPQCRGIGGDWVSPQGEAIPLNGLVHRLDRETSGILLAAKTQEEFDRLRGEFKARRVQKRYRAFVRGHVAREQGEIIAEIVRTTERPRRWAARPCEAADTRAAITEYATIVRVTGAPGELATYVALSPKTGRTHQLRVHLASIGYPIVGDRLYGPDEPLLGFTRLALHASEITVPMADGLATYVAPLPQDFINAGAVL